MMLDCMAAAAMTVCHNFEDSIIENRTMNNDVLSTVDWEVIYNQVGKWNAKTLMVIFEEVNGNENRWQFFPDRILSHMKSFAFMMCNYETCCQTIRKVCKTKRRRRGGGRSGPVDLIREFRYRMADSVIVDRMTLLLGAPQIHGLHETGQVARLVTGKPWDARLGRQIRQTHPFDEPLDRNLSKMKIMDGKKLVAEKLSYLCGVVQQLVKVLHASGKPPGETSKLDKIDACMNEIGPLLHRVCSYIKAFECSLWILHQELIIALSKKIRRAPEWIHTAQEELRKAEDVRRLLKFTACAFTALVTNEEFVYLLRIVRMLQSFW